MLLVSKPKSKLLQKYIINYNIFISDGEKEISYFAFPTQNVVFALSKHTLITHKENCIYFKQDKNKKFSINVLGKYLKPIKLNYKGKINEFSINFTTLGFNYFFDQNFGKYANKTITIIESKLLLELCTEIFKAENFENQIDIADLFFKSSFKEIKLNYLPKAIDLITNNELITIKEIADQCNVTTRTLDRAFKNYVGCSPRNLKKIIRFRKAISNQFLQNGSNFTDIALESDYYDSSHFIKEFKKLTNENPSAFFKNLSKVSNFNYPFKYVK